MGLPNKWTDPHYGVCLSLWAAVAHLKALGATCTPEKNAIRFTLPDQPEVRIEAVYIAAAGWMFPLSELEKGR
jgi:hypothetical protein